MDGPPFDRCSHELRYHIPAFLTLSGTDDRLLIASAHTSTKEFPGGVWTKCIAEDNRVKPLTKSGGTGKTSTRGNSPSSDDSLCTERVDEAPPGSAPRMATR